ncbi:MAG: PIG-L family deacetylase [Ilyomonas sp.]
MISEQFAKISFYIVAHADDWQLFMQPNVYYDLLTPSHKVVFIITTAGDAGKDETYWRAREEGMKSSVRFCLAPKEIITESTGERELNFHPVHYWSANNAISYFLRLPDGNLDGKGFSSNHYQSLSKFGKGEINKINAIDFSTSYHSWQDLLITIEAIIRFESENQTDITVHYQDPDRKRNPDDHADHIATGQAIQQIPFISGFKQLLYTDYSVNSNNEKQMTGEELFWKIGIFSAYEKTVYDICGYSTLKEGVSTYVNWCLSTAEFISINPGSVDEKVIIETGAQ